MTAITHKSGLFMDAVTLPSPAGSWVLTANARDEPLNQRTCPPGHNPFPLVNYSAALFRYPSTHTRCLLKKPRQQKGILRSVRRPCHSWPLTEPPIRIPNTAMCYWSDVPPTRASRKEEKTRDETRGSGRACYKRMRWFNFHLIKRKSVADSFIHWSYPRLKL